MFAWTGLVVGFRFRSCAHGVFRLNGESKESSPTAVKLPERDFLEIVRQSEIDDRVGLWNRFPRWRKREFHEVRKQQGGEESDDLAILG